MQHPNKILKDYKRLHLLYEKGEVFTSVDTETTGISPNHGRIMEIGAVKFDNKGIIDSWSSLFNPEMEIPQFIQDLTHINQQMVQNQPLICQKLPDFLAFIDNTILLAHNAQFDLNFINFECEKAGFRVTTNKTIDTLRFSKFMYPQLEKHKLDFLADHFKINKGSSHRALDDAITCMEVFKKLVNPN